MPSSIKGINSLIREFIDKKEERINWPPDRLKSFRNTALRIFMERIKSKSTWHSKRLKDVDCSNITEDDLASIPSMSKNDLLNNFDEIVTVPNLKLRICKNHLKTEASGGGFINRRYRVSISGGTSGNPALTVFNTREFQLNAMSSLRLISRWAKQNNFIEDKKRIVRITTPDPVFRSQHVARSLNSTYIISIVNPIQSIIAELNMIQPDILFTYPSILPRLAEEAQEGRLKISPKLIIGGAEPMLVEHASAVKRVWNSKLFDGWGSTEVGVLAVASGYDPGMLLLDDFVILEPVNKDGLPVKKGEQTEKVFVTPLFRYTLPLLRYEVTDQVNFIDTPASCGSGFRRISNVENRLEDVFKYYGSIEVHPKLFLSILGAEVSILEYQVHQTKKGADVLVTSNKNVDCDRLKKLITAGLLESGLQNPVVSIKIVDRIGRTGAAKKFKRFFPLNGK